MNLDRCLITLEPLKGKKELSKGYTSKGIKYLTGSSQTSVTLPFTRSQFIQVGPINQKGMSISGYQPKLLMGIDNNEFKVLKNHSTYILKASPEQFPMLAENEHAIMLVMKKLGFEVPPFGLIAFLKERSEESVEYAFIIKRYDRVNALEKIHQEQLDGSMNISNKYGDINGVSKISYEQVCNFLIKNIDSSLKFKQDLFLRIVYAYVLGNNDLHLRNFGILVPKIGRESLAPVYDYVSSIPYFEGASLAFLLFTTEENEKALPDAINTKHVPYKGYDFILFAKLIGISEKMALKLLFDATNKKASIILDTINVSYMKDEHKSKVIAYTKLKLKALTETIRKT
ncbi:HipA domain-containing protein [Psychromonas sp. 14N.309.X.WAT.B.A12]|uniref:type II toxin-antitoxin system HipA family toxin n=1 Tax=Psychromonas sp. 14N.309.X.WAT.B.A12 TaxID=2998322 RepID=UPI0025B20C7E|nr:HipA domain-containing protein [Psychromonas sp. 14N.309.X.WAT.B.A12]MDN2662647.1 HipA domain-containing protein [Psychromonas sp. 14N.309.X.WAT.B.A12]